MEIQEIKKIISEAKNIYLIPNNTPEATTSALALFYTLKELSKNVNIVLDKALPENLNFLIPSLDFISYPKNFVISIPKNTADISQIYYDKDENGLKIHLTVDRGIIKKENMSFYFSDTKPDLIITFGVKDFKEHMAQKMDSFGFLLDSPILNIDNEDGATKNENFGNINLIENKPLFEIIMRLIINLH